MNRIGFIAGAGVLAVAGAGGGAGGGGVTGQAVGGAPGGAGASPPGGGDEGEGGYITVDDVALLAPCVTSSLTYALFFGVD